MKQSIQEVMTLTKLQAQKMGNHYAGSEHILLALLQEEESEFAHCLRKQGVSYQQIHADLMVLFGSGEVNEGIEFTQVAEEIFDDAFHLAKKKQMQEDDTCVAYVLLTYEHSVAQELLLRSGVDVEQVLEQLMQPVQLLSKYKELSDMAEHPTTSFTGREKELETLITILSRKEKANPLLVGEAGVGKTALVEQLALRMKEGNVPSSLQGALLYELNLNQLVAGTKYRGDFEEKLQAILDVLMKHPNLIVFIDEIHMMIGAGKAEGSIDVASVLKPYLARGKMRLIGATTPHEYESHMEKDRALQRRFQKIVLKEPDDEMMLEILRGKAIEYGEYHHVIVKESLFPHILSYSKAYLPQRKFPDKALDLLDLACVHCTMRQDDVVSKEDLLATMEQLTHIPFQSPQQMEYIAQCISGQEEVVKQVIAHLHHLNHGAKTLGVWLFQGASHTGKHTLCECIAKVMFANETLLELDAVQWRTQLPFIISTLKQDPYHLCVIHSLEQADAPFQQLLTSACLKGELEYNGKGCALHHTLFILLYEEKQEQRPMHFYQQATSSNLIPELKQCIETTFHFSPLQMRHQIQMIASMLDKASLEVSQERIQASIETSHSLEEAFYKIKHQTLLQS